MSIDGEFVLALLRNEPEKLIGLFPDWTSLYVTSNALAKRKGSAFDLFGIHANCVQDYSIDYYKINDEYDRTRICKVFKRAAASDAQWQKAKPTAGYSNRLFTDTYEVLWA